MGWCAGLTALALVLSTRDSWVVWAGGQLLLGVTLVQWFVILHECGHETLFRTRRLDVVVGHVASVFTLIPFQCWKRVHGQHHKWTGWQDRDPTTVALVPRPLGRGERFLTNVCWRFWIPLFSVLYRVGNFWNVRRLCRLFPPKAQRRALTLNVVLLGALYVGLAWGLGLARVGSLAGLGFVLSLLFEDPLLLSQHTHIPLNLSRGTRVRPYPTVEQEIFTRSLRFPSWFSVGVLLNLDAHELHHMYPFVPGYALRRIEYTPTNEVSWWQWVRRAKALPGEVFLFQNRTESGFDI